MCLLFAFLFGMGGIVMQMKNDRRHSARTCIADDLLNCESESCKDENSDLQRMLSSYRMRKSVTVRIVLLMY